MDDTSWGALAIALSAIAGIWTWYAFRNRGFGAGVRGVAITMLPIAAWMTNTLELAGDIVGAVSDWALRLVFSPTVWMGLVLAVVAVLLFVVSFKLPGGAKSSDSDSKPVDGSAGKKAVKPKKSKGGDGGISDALGDDADDIQAILRKHGIS